MVYVYYAADSDFFIFSYKYSGEKSAPLNRKKTGTINPLVEEVQKGYGAEMFFVRRTAPG
jgi:hypothetical protein